MKMLGETAADLVAPVTELRDYAAATVKALVPTHLLNQLESFVDKYVYALRSPVVEHMVGTGRLYWPSADGIGTEAAYLRLYL